MQITEPEIKILCWIEAQKVIPCSQIQATPLDRKVVKSLEKKELILMNKYPYDCAVSLSNKGIFLLEELNKRVRKESFTYSETYFSALVEKAQSFDLEQIKGFWVLQGSI